MILNKGKQRPAKRLGQHPNIPTYLYETDTSSYARSAVPSRDLSCCFASDMATALDFSASRVHILKGKPCASLWGLGVSDFVVATL